MGPAVIFGRCGAAAHGRREVAVRRPPAGLLFGGVGGGAVGVEAGEEVGEDGFKHGQAGADDSCVGLDDGPDGGIEGAVSGILGSGACAERGDAGDGSRADAE